MRIQEVEKITGITKRNIHFYIEEGLISPIKSENNYYDFCEDDIKKLKIISLFRSYELSVNSIKSLMQYPGTVNYELYATIAKLKAQITHNQIAIENLIVLTEKIPPNVSLFELEKYLGDAKRTKASRFDIDAMYPINNYYMVTVFLCVAFVKGEESVYQRYVWNTISEQLNKFFGDTIYFLNDIIEHSDISSLNEVSRVKTIRANNVMQNPIEESYEEFENIVNKFLNDEQLIEKWKLLYTPLICKLNMFYKDNAELFEVYNSSFKLYQDNIKTIAKKYIKENRDLILRLEEKTGIEFNEEDLSQLYTFDCEFFNFSSVEDMKIKLI